MQRSPLVLSIILAAITFTSTPSAHAGKCVARNANEILQPLLSVRNNIYDEAIYGKETAVLGAVTNAKNQFNGLYYEYLKARKDRYGNVVLDPRGMAVQDETCDFFSPAALAVPGGAAINTVGNKKTLSIEVRFGPKSTVVPLKFTYLYNGIWGRTPTDEAFLRFNLHTQRFEILDEEGQYASNAFLYANRLWGKLVGIREIELSQ